MKKMIFALVALMVALPMVAQERVNRAKARWIGEGEKITNVMGWGYDDTAGEWVGCANVIETKVSNKKYTNSDYWKSHTYNNIISIQLKKLEYQGDTLLILVREFWDGGYKYPRIKEGWEHWKSTAFMILDDTHIELLRKLPNTVSHINVVTTTQGLYEKEELDVDLIRKKIEGKYQTKSTIHIYEATDGNIRFIFQEIEFMESLPRLNEDIGKGYFEMPKETFNSLFKIAFTQ